MNGGRPRKARGTRPKTQSYHSDSMLEAEGLKPKARKPKLESLLTQSPEAAEAVRKAALAAAAPRVVAPVRPTLVVTPPAPAPVAAVPSAAALDAMSKDMSATDLLPTRKLAKKFAREEMYARLLKAQGSQPITTAVDSFFAAGHELDEEDDAAWVQVLEHRDETRVREAIDKLAQRATSKLAMHRLVLLQRLRRIEESGDERETREAAAVFRQRVL
ncbi:MAG: hypothetical protein Q8Q09_06725 [Deltaproteobacteria bacterium]|nr:hypothetical protein [Deltaproteobacteria bacterium]